MPQSSRSWGRLVDRRSPALKFVQEYWLWFAIPFGVVIAGVFLLYWLLDTGAASPFVYPIFGN